MAKELTVKGLQEGIKMAVIALEDPKEVTPDLVKEHYVQDDDSSVVQQHKLAVKFVMKKLGWGYATVTFGVASSIESALEESLDKARDLVRVPGLDAEAVNTEEASIKLVGLAVDTKKSSVKTVMKASYLFKDARSKAALKGLKKGGPEGLNAAVAQYDAKQKQKALNAAAKASKVEEDDSDIIDEFDDAVFEL